MSSLADVAPAAYDLEGQDNGYVRLAVALGEGLGAAAVVPVRISEDGQHLLVFTSALAGTCRGRRLG